MSDANTSPAPQITAGPQLDDALAREVMGWPAPTLYGMAIASRVLDGKAEPPSPDEAASEVYVLKSDEDFQCLRREAWRPSLDPACMVSVIDRMRELGYAYQAVAPAAAGTPFVVIFQSQAKIHPYPPGQAGSPILQLSTAAAALIAIRARGKLIAARN